LDREITARLEEEGLPVLNPLVWRMVWDTYAMLVVDLASLRNGMTDRHHGLFALLRTAPHLIARMPASQEQREGQAAEVDYLIERTFGKLPPLDGQDVDRAAMTFRKATQAIDDDRNKVRAHRFEPPPSARDKLQRYAARLDVVRQQVQIVEQYLVDIGVLLGQPYILEDSAGQPRQTARDLADLLQYGSFERALEARRDVEGRPVP